MTNLAYLWMVHHGQTFSLVSVANSFYFVPPMLRKPLSDLTNKQLTEEEKQEWLPHVDIIKDSMTLHKVVTYRATHESIVSCWNSLNFNEEIWMKVIHEKEKEAKPKCHQDFWNNITINYMLLNSRRTEKGFYNLHWMMPHEMPIALNV